MGAAVDHRRYHRAHLDLNQGCRWDLGRVCGESWLNDRFGVSMILGQFGNLLTFTITAIAGVIAAMALSIVLSRSRAGMRLARWGRNSLHLLIVNCVFLELANPVISIWIAPRVSAADPLFFPTLLALTIVLNLWAAALMKRPLRRLQSISSSLAGWAVNIARRGAAIVAQRVNRVSQAHEQP
ncbi:MAG: hypothetical protein R3C16_04205 [Hyphomonadaceae bacterium]